MPTVKISNNDQEIEVTAGTRILHMAESNSTPLLFGCRAASCGVCVIKILSGMENIGPIKSDEKEVLDSMSADKDERLGCQAIVNGDITLKIE